jgi:hypothetical protein
MSVAGALRRQAKALVKHRNADRRIDRLVLYGEASLAKPEAAAVARAGARRRGSTRANRPADPAHQDLEHPLPAGRVYAATHNPGKISGNLHRPRRYNRRLQRAFYISALFSIRHYEESRRFYDRKRSEGKRHIQAVLALARRRVNVLSGPSSATDGPTNSRHQAHSRLDRPH